MIYITLILLVVFFIWIFLCEIKGIKKASAIRKGLADYKAILTRNEEILRVWLLISYLILFVYLLCYLFVFGSGAASVITGEMIKKMLKYALLTLIFPLNIAIIAPQIFVLSLNRTLLAKADVDGTHTSVDKTLMLATFAGYFIVVAACTACMKYELISPLAWFSILTYGKVAALGLLAKALKQ